MGVVIWHNPHCSKSRAALALIEGRGLTPQIVRYLEAPPTAGELLAAAEMIGVPVRALARTKDAACGALGLDDPALSEEEAAAALAANPALIERPIVFSKGRAAIGRPPEAILAIL